MDTPHKTTVLMVDDERLLLLMYKESFEKHGFDVLTFTDVDEALDSLRAGLNPDFVLFDINMPNSKSGFEFIEVVSQEKLAPTSLKVALTNEGREGVVARTSELGADAHILKSQYSPSEIVTLLRDMLEKRKV